MRNTFIINQQQFNFKNALTLINTFIDNITINQHQLYEGTEYIGSLSYNDNDLHVIKADDIVKSFSMVDLLFYDTESTLNEIVEFLKAV